MRIGFTGTRTVPAKAVDAVRAFVLASASDGDEYTTGACLGFDALAAHALLDAFPERRHRLVVPSNQKQIDWSIINRFLRLIAAGNRNITIEYMPDGSTYKQRNQRIVDHSDVLVAVVGYPEAHGRSLRSGSWQTIRLARLRTLPPARLLVLSEL